MNVEKLSACCLFCTGSKSKKLISIIENDFDLLQKITEYLPIQLGSCTFSKDSKCCEECVAIICTWDKFYKRIAANQNKEGIMLKNVGSMCDKDVANKSSEPELRSPIAESVKNRVENSFEVSLNEKITCYFCDLEHTTSEELGEHLVNEHSEMIFCCDVCNKYLPRPHLMAHMTGHAHTTTYNSMSNETSLEPSNNLKCDKCDRIFRSCSGIKHHINTMHLKLKKYDCEFCNRSFTSKRVLLNHERSFHNKNKRQYVCKECGKGFKTDSTLYTHLKLHKDSKTFNCLHCDKSFRLKHHLSTHMVQHLDSNAKYFECNFCHKRFAALDNLRKHRKIHDLTNGDFICHICGAKMKQRRYLREHMKKVHLQINRRN